VNRPRLAAAILFIVGLWPASAAAFSDNDALGALVAAYPDFLVKHENRALYWRDAVSADETRPFEQTLRSASVLDQMRLPYPRGMPAKPPEVNDDPGRFRNVAFFRKMYGNCFQGEVVKNLVPVVWLPKTYNHSIRATSVNGVAQKLATISEEIELLSPAIKRAAYPLAGGYACRGIADTGEPSMHSYGAAVDLNISFGDYWYWQRGAEGPIHHRNRMPSEIVDIFERHGFIWGGKWYHYDTMHFEYRPELLVGARRQ
jgi:hypothetical protein